MNDLHERLRANLEGRYTIERELGRGGMATVYLARDLRHDRPVALKVLHAELAAALGAERFQREIRMAARLQHPHILTVHDSGEIPGVGATAPTLWFTMPFVEGESLRDRLRRERQLPLADAVRIAREAASALDSAHRHNVIHRDIKPENLLLTADGQVLVADFGIARALGGGQATGGAGGQETALTETGTSIGTPAYMSPEQASGERALDGRTDIYSLGVVLYEMLAGEPPFTGPTAQAIIAKRFTGEIPALRKARPSVPEDVERIVTRALAMVPADRFASAGELARALEGGQEGERAGGQLTPTIAEIAGATGRPARPPARLPVWLAFVLGLLVTASMGMFVWQRSHRSSERDDGVPKRLAVLPFENLGDSTNEYFSDGMTDEVRGKLAALPGLQVIAHRSAAEYKGTAKSYQQIGQELGVQYLLVGKVRWEKQASGQSRVRVSPELIDVASSSTRWQQPFDAVLSDVFQVQGEIATKVARSLDVALGETERQRLEVRPTGNLAAYDAFLRGEEASGRMNTADAIALERAATAYERAVALDSTFMLAWARLSQARSVIYSNGIPTPEGAEQARAAAERALALDPHGVEGHLALGTYHDFVQRDYARALEQYALGQRAAPNSADLLTAAALSEQSLGRWEDALGHLTRAEALDPRSVLTIRRLATTLLWLRRYPEALAAADRGLALQPANLTLREIKAMTFLGRGDLAGARAVIRAAPPDVDPTALVAYMATYWDLVWVLDEEQQRLLLRLTPNAFGGDRFNWAWCLAQGWALRGDKARARAYADSAQRAAALNLQETPNDAQRIGLRGVALAYLGRNDEAVREGERGAALLPISRDAYTGPYYQHQLGRIYVRVGQPDKALDILEQLLSLPYYLSPAWLRIDPEFAPLRSHPRFQRLVQSGATT